ncbi:MAG: hypothetical protein E6G62_09805 [Actinobacteria bacterium]|nr:MAG: hypothetical protein E6G62_09805 [Actinomycetota bacterium]
MRSWNSSGADDAIALPHALGGAHALCIGGGDHGCVRGTRRRPSVGRCDHARMAACFLWHSAHRGSRCIRGIHDRSRSAAAPLA